MTTRIAHMMKALEKTPAQFAALMGADESVVSRLRNGRRETGQQTVLLDLLCERHNLPALHSSVFSAALSAEAVAPVSAGKPALTPGSSTGCEGFSAEGAAP